LITDEEAAAILGPARISLSRIEAELAAAQTNTNVIELHPQAVQRFKENIEQLAQILSDKNGTPNLEIIGDHWLKASLSNLEKPAKSMW
jgi:site-specific DNA recombinase